MVCYKKRNPIVAIYNNHIYTLDTMEHSIHMCLTYSLIQSNEEGILKCFVEHFSYLGTVINVGRGTQMCVWRIKTLDSQLSPQW